MKRTLRMRPALLAALTLSFALLVAGSVSVGVGAQTPATGGSSSSGTPVIFFAADGMRPDLVDKYAKQGIMPTMDGPEEEGRHGQERPSAGLPAEHRRRLVHALDGRVAGRARLDEQHVPSDRRGQLQQLHQLCHDRHPPGRPHRPGRRAGGQDRRVHGVGRHAQPGSRSERPGRRLPHVHRRPRHRPQLRPARAARRRQRLRRAVPAGHARRRGGLDERPGLLQHGEADVVHAQQLPARRQRRLGRLHLRLDQRRIRQLQPGARGLGRQRQERRHGRGERPAGRMGGRQADDRERLARGPVGRLLPQGHRPVRRPLEVPHLLHVGAAGERDLQRARPGRLGRLRGEAEPRLPDLDSRRLRAARGGNRRRGHVRRAGPHVEGRALGLPRVHHGPGPVRARRQARPPARGHADDRRVPAPVHRARDQDRHRRQPEPLLRRSHERRRPRRPRGRARGLHQGRLPRGRRHARAGA